MVRVVLRPDEVFSTAWKLVFVQPSMFCKRETHIGIRTLQQNDKLTQLKFPLFMRSPNSLGFWKNDLSGLWNISDMMSSWNGEFSLKSILTLGLISCTSYEIWLCIIFYLIDCSGSLRSGSWKKRTSGIKGLLFTILSFALFIVCMLFVFLASILVLPGISCDKFDGWLIAWLVGSGFFLFDLVLPWPICIFCKFPCFGKESCFSGLRLGFKLIPTPWTSGNLIPLDLAWDHVWIKYLSLQKFLKFSSRIWDILNEIGMISLGLLSSLFCHDRKSLKIMSFPFI